jgi:hypothetical protein
MFPSDEILPAVIPQAAKNSGRFFVTRRSAGAVTDPFRTNPVP